MCEQAHAGSIWIRLFVTAAAWASQLSSCPPRAFPPFSPSPPVSPPSLLPALLLQEGEAFQNMYENGGILASEDGSVSMLAGSTLGGGTRINW